MPSRIEIEVDAVVDAVVRKTNPETEKWPSRFGVSIGGLGWKDPILGKLSDAQLLSRVERAVRDGRLAKRQVKATGPGSVIYCLPEAAEAFDRDQAEKLAEYERNERNTERAVGFLEDVFDRYVPDDADDGLDRHHRERISGIVEKSYRRPPSDVVAVARLVEILLDRTGRTDRPRYEYEPPV